MGQGTAPAGELVEAERASGSVLLMAVNANGLSFFMLCNVLVGATKAAHSFVHGGTPTWQNLSSFEGIVWVVLYCIAACGAAWLAHGVGVRVDASLLGGGGCHRRRSKFRS